MKKNNLKVLLGMFAFIMAFTFVACGDDDEEDKAPSPSMTGEVAQKMVGTWFGFQAEQDNNGLNMIADQIEFKADGSFTMKEMKAKEKNNYAIEDRGTRNGMITFTGANFAMTVDGKPFATGSIKLEKNDNVAIVTVIPAEEGRQFTMELERIPDPGQFNLRALFEETIRDFLEGGE